MSEGRRTGIGENPGLFFPDLTRSQHWSQSSSMYAVAGNLHTISTNKASDWMILAAEFRYGVVRPWSTLSGRRPSIE